MGKVTPKPAVKLTENKVVYKLWEQFAKSAQIATPNGYIYRWESDLIILSKTGLTTEYEVKLSVQDFNRDHKKKIVGKVDFFYEKKSKLASIQDGEGPNRFFYVFPRGMIEDSRVPEWAGIIHICSHVWGNQNEFEYISPSIVRQPKWLHKNKAGQDLIQKINTCLYYKVFNRLKKLT